MPAGQPHGGRHWEQNTSAALSFVADLEVDPTDNDHVYVLSNDQPGIYISTDAGVTFVRRPLPAENIAGDRLLAAADGKTLYFIAAPRVFISQDRGTSWEERTPIQPEGRFLDAAQVDLDDPNIVYASLFSLGTFITRDGGRSWRPLMLPNIAQAAPSTRDFAVSPREPQRLYLSNVSGLFVTLDKGQTFTRLMSRFTVAIGLDFQDPNILYAAISGGDLLRSTDRGATWTDVTGNLFSLLPDEIIADPGPSGRVLVTSERGILSAETGGDVWVTSHAGINARTITSFSLSDSELFASSRASAVSVRSGSDTLTPLDINRLFIALNTASTQVAIVSLGSFPDTKVLGLLSGGPLGRSEDGGQRWRALPGAPRGIGLLGASRGRPANVLAATTDGRLFRSTDDGDTFEDVTARVPTGRSIRKIQFARNQPLTAYLAFQTNPPPGGFILPGIYRTVDGGATFVELPMPQGGLIEALAIDPLDPQVVYLGTSTQLLKSTDGGATWSSMSLPFSGVTGLHVDPVRPKILLASTFFSVLRSVNGGRTWQSLPPARTQGSVNQDVTTDPARPGVIRVATGMHSIQQMTISPDVAIAATNMPATLPSDGPIEVTYTVSNLGPFDASGVGVMLRLPSSAQDVRARMSNGACTVMTSRVTCTSDALLVDQPETITLNFTSVASTAFTVTAEVSANEPDTNVSNNAVMRTSNVAEVADLSVRLDGTQSAVPGGEIAYRLTATNTGPSPATAVRIAFQLDPTLMLGTLSSPGSNLNCTSGTTGAVTCDVATLASGQSASVSLNVSPSTNAGMFQSTAQVSGNGQDPASDNNRALIVTTVVAAAPPPAPTPQPQPQPTPMNERRRGGGGGSMAPLLLLVMAALALARSVAARRRSGAAVVRRI